MSGSEDRSFKGIWFPKEVWLDKRLTAIEKMVLLEIDSLDGDDGCYATNEYLADFCQCGQSTVSRAISKLKELEYIEEASFDGRTRKLHSKLSSRARQTSQIGKADSSNRQERILEETTSKEVDISGAKPVRARRKAKPFVPPTVEEVQAYITEKGYHFSAQGFCSYYEASNWHFRDGRPVKSWKQCCVTWENNHHNDRPKGGLSRDYSEYAF